MARETSQPEVISRPEQSTAVQSHRRETAAVPTIQPVPPDDSRSTNNGTPTPGTDDTPYIRFAIEQLTRDEELLGTGRQGSVVSADYPVERIVPAEVSGFSTAAPKPQERPRLGSESRDRSASPGLSIPSSIYS